MAQFLSKLRARYKAFSAALDLGPLGSELAGKSLTKKALFARFLAHHFFGKVTMEDWLQYRFYLLNRRGRKTFIDHRYLLWLMREVNDPTLRPLFDDKAQFAARFAPYFGREHLDTRTCSADDFAHFCARHDVFIAKPLKGLFGKGVHKVQAQGSQAQLEELKGQEALLEELILQHPVLAQLNASTLNTLRLVTLIDDEGEIHLMGAALRIGRAGKEADNFHHGGIAAKVDLDTGLLVTPGRDKEGRRYVAHPDSGVTLPGWQVPCWSELKAFAFALAAVEPKARYVGWDIALTPDGPCVVEGNFGSDPDILQTLDNNGVRPAFDAILRKNYAH